MRKFVLFIVLFIWVGFTYSQCTDLFISEYIEGSGTNKALEIYNPTDQPIDLSQYQLVRYSNGGITPNAVGIAGIIQPYDVFVSVLDKRDPNGTGVDTMVWLTLQAYADTFLCPVYNVNKMHYFNGNDAVTLELTNGTYIDIIGKIGEDPGDGWTSDTSAGFTSANGWWLAWTANHTMIRKPAIKEGVTTNPSFFNPAVQWDTIAKNFFDSLQFHTCECYNPIGFNELKKEHDFFCYPNPVKGDDFLVKGSEIIYSAEMYDLLGKSVYYRINEIPRGDMRISTNGINAGLYMVRITFKDQSQALHKVIIK
ncbi:lamin tail domain-containing protein [candidate division KSB1 bacterium]